MRGTLLGGARQAIGKLRGGCSVGLPRNAARGEPRERAFPRGLGASDLLGAGLSMGTTSRLLGSKARDCRFPPGARACGIRKDGHSVANGRAHRLGSGDVGSRRKLDHRVFRVGNRTELASLQVSGPGRRGDQRRVAGGFLGGVGWGEHGRRNVCSVDLALIGEMARRPVRVFMLAMMTRAAWPAFHIQQATS